MKLSVVTSVYRTAQFLEDFATRVQAAAAGCGLEPYELIVVVDGSPDDAIPILRGMKPRHPALRAIELSRNFGHHAALWCGLSKASGELIFLADSDLETAPEVLIDLLAALTKGDHDMAFAFQPQRSVSWARRLAARAFWLLFNAMAGTRIHPGMLTERLMRRHFLDALLQMDERPLFLTGMMDWIGFRTIAVPTTRTPRPGRPSYTWADRLRLALGAISSFSVVPIRLLFLAGGGIAVFAMLSALSLIVVKLVSPGFIVTGFTALAVLLLFALGSILAAIGIIGQYLGQVFLQAKGRPIFLVRREF